MSKRKFCVEINFGDCPNFQPNGTVRQSELVRLRFFYGIPWAFGSMGHTRKSPFQLNKYPKNFEE